MSSGFISEAEIAEQRKRRQEEWERVRTAEQPLEKPEEAYDPRSLFERLQEQKLKQDVEYEEAHKLKNMIKGLDDDEIEFLDLVDRTKLAEERKKNMEEEKEMRDFKAAVATLHEKSLDERLKQELKQPVNHKSSSSGKSSKVRLLAGVVVKKPNKSDDSQGVKRKASESEDSIPKKKTNSDSKSEQSITTNSQEINNLGAMKCIGILPGLGSYEDSSDSDNSSNTDEEIDCGKNKYDILGRVISADVEEVKQAAKEH